MSLRRGGNSASKDGDDSSSLLKSALSPSRPNAQASKQSWISGGLVLLVVGGFLSTLTPESSSSSSSSSKSRLRASSSSLGSSIAQHRIPNFKPIHEQCTVWVAQSSVKGLKGYGVFTTRDLAKNEHILGVPDGVSIPIIGYWQRGEGRLETAKDAWMSVWDNYWWGSGVADHVSYEAGSDVVDYQIAFGALPNHNCLLAKLSYVYPHPPYDDTMVDRFTDPGAGAFTYSRGRQFTVEGKVQAGSEIFLNYGYCRHGVKDDPDWVDHTYVSGDYSQAAALIWKTLQQKETSDGPLLFDSKGKLLPPKNVKPMILGLLPETQTELEEMAKKVKSQTELSYYLAEYKAIDPHTPQWIQENGMCLENLIPLHSTIKQAGQGAFAQYAMKKDSIIMPAPLLQIMDRDALVLFDEETGARVNDQLLLNYCFAHPESSMLLCPDTQAVLINHCSKRTKECGKQGPNAAIRWSRGWDPTSDDWRKKTFEELSKEPGRGLAFEVYALRDIQPGEEVFIDYGPDWEAAWEKHVTNWKPPERPKDWITATEANSRTDRILEEFISGDLRREVDNLHLFTACQYHTSMGDRNAIYSKPNKSWKDWSDKKILDKFAEDGAKFGYPDDALGYSKHDDTSHWPCSVLLKEKEGIYTVRIHQNPWENELDWEKNDLPRILTGYKRSDIHYFVKPFASDQQLPGAFRYPLGMPDGMFPEQWKNLKKPKLR